MRMARINKQHFKYALFEGKQPVYEYDSDGNKIVDYVDSDGTTYYVQTGETEMKYTAPKEIFANLSMNAGDVQVTEYGIDNTSYDAVVVYLLNEYPLTETSLVWVETEPVIVNGNVDPNSADYRVASVKPSINYTKLLLRKLAK